MQLISIDRQTLNSFLAKQTNSEFLQSWEWGEFQNDQDRNIFRFAVEGSGNILATISFLKNKLPAGQSYFYAPRGPIVNSKEKNQPLVFNGVEFLFKEIKKIAKKENAIFIRIEPLFKTDLLKQSIQKSIDVQPSKTLILDLSKTEDELLKDMHQKTRYNVRLSQKKGVIVREGKLNEFDKFWDLMEITKNRDEFRLHSREYYYEMINKIGGHETSIKQEQIENKNLFIKLFFAEYENKILATGLFSFFGNTVTYMHGASSNEMRSLMAPYNLQWQVAQKAKAMDYRFYDFYGIDKDRWPGVSRFKNGFGGFVFSYPGTYDIILNQYKYNIYKLIRKIKRRK